MIRRLGWGQVALLCALGSLLLQPIPAAAVSATVLQAHVEGDINTITVGYVGQAVRRAEAERAAAILVVINTPGGDSQSMDSIVTALLNSKVPVIAFVYPAGSRADSALALFGFVLRKAIAARSQRAYVGAETLIGMKGVVRQPLAPQGTVFVAGALWRATSPSAEIPAGTEVRVMNRRGLELEVAPIDTAPSAAAEPAETQRRS